MKNKSSILHPPKLITTKFKCLNCGNFFKKEYKWELYSAECPKCKKNVITFGEYEFKKEKEEEIRHREPLTNWQKKKLEFYKSEKKWHEDIESRRILPNGDVAIVDHKGEIKEVRPRR